MLTITFNTTKGSLHNLATNSFSVLTFVVTDQNTSLVSTSIIVHRPINYMYNARISYPRSVFFNLFFEVEPFARILIALGT